MKHTNNKALSLLLTLTLALGLLPWSAMPARAEHEPETVVGTFADLQELLDMGGTVTLEKDYTASADESALNVTGTVALNLNGHTINRGLTSAAENGYVLKVEGNLTLTDSSTDKAGKITGGCNRGKGGGVYVYGGTLNMRGGTITGNTATNVGGGVYIVGSSGGEFRVSGTPSIFGNFKDKDDEKTPNNVYLPEGETITVDGLGSGACIGVTMETIGTFTSGRKIDSAAAVAHFFSDDANFTVAREDENNEARLTEGWLVVNNWTDLQNAMSTSGCVSVRLGNDISHTYGTEGTFGLSILSGHVTLDLAGHSIIAAGQSALAVWGSLTLLDSAGHGSLYNGKFTNGGGIRILGGGKITMLGGSINSGKTYSNSDDATSNKGGGVHVGNGCSFTLVGGTIEECTAGNGGGVYVTNGGLFTMHNGLIKHNSGTGGGVYVEGGGAFVMNGGVISGNTGSGVFVWNGTFTMNGGTISDNTELDGGGVYVDGGMFTMNGGTISDNAASSSGGGVKVYNGGRFTMNGGTISGNTAKNGGGVYVGGLNTVIDCTFTMNGGKISSNNTTSGNINGGGGGVYVASSGTFKVSGSPRISNNVKGGTITDGVLSGGTPNNVYLSEGKVITVTGALTGNIGVTLNSDYEAGPFTRGLSENGGTNALACFRSDNNDYVMGLTSGGEAALAVPIIVTFNANGGTGDDVTQKLPSGLTAALTASTFARTGYTFTGWNTAANGSGTSYADKASVTLTADTTLYAQWTAIPTTAPTIDTQPQNLNLTYGYTTGNVLTVVANAAEEHTITGYQWYSNTSVSNKGGTLIEGATGASYTVPTGKDAGNYYFYSVVTAARTDNNLTATTASSVATVTIAPKPVTITGVTATSRAYNGENTVVLAGGTVDNKVGSDDVTVDLSNATGTMADANAGTNKPVTVTGAKLGGAAAGNYALSEQPTGVTVTISKIDYTGTKTASATVRSNQATTDATLTLPALPDGASYAPSGTVGGTTSALIDGTPTVSGTTLTYSTTSQQNQASATITVDVTNATNYNDYTVVVTITAKNKENACVAITGGDLAKSYGDAAFTMTGTVMSAGTNGLWTWTSSDTGIAEIGATTGTVTIKKVGSTTITARYESDTTVGTATITLTVNRKPITVKADDKRKTYGDFDPALTATVTGLVGSDTVAYTLSRAEGETAGTYAITPSGVATQGNYTVTFTAGTFTINRKSLTAAMISTIAAQTYTGKEIKPTVTVKDKNTPLTSSAYTAEYKNNTDPGESTVTVTGKGNYTGTVTATFQIYGIKGVWVGGKLTATAHVENHTNALLIAAVYDGNGKQVNVEVIPLIAGQTSYPTGITAKTSGYTYKLMLVSKSTYAPLCKAWSEKAN